MHALGIRNVIDLGREAKFSCPFEGHSHGDQNPSACMNKESTAWICFGCKERGNAVGFLSKLEGVSPTLAAKWIRERYEGGYSPPRGSVLEDVLNILESTSPIGGGGEDASPQSIDETIVWRYRVDWRRAWKASNEGQRTGWVEYIFDRGFTWDTLDEWEFGYDPDSDRIVIPIRSPEGELLGFKARSWRSEVHPKYKVLGGFDYGFEPVEVGKVLFGLDHAVVEDRLVVVEGEFNTVMMHQLGIQCAVGVAGSFFTERMARLIRDRTREVVLFFDSDDAGHEGIARATELLEPHVRVRVVPDHEGDPCEMTGHVVDELIAASKTSFSIAFI